MFTAIVVDDEPKSIKNLEILLTDYCKEDIKIINTAANALEAIKKIIEEKPDVVFLDVQMPGFNGFDVLDQIKNSSPLIIFTTAHKEYAVDALRKEAFDYLVKPIDIDELKNCILRVREKLAKKNAETEKTPTTNVIEISVKDALIFIKSNDIIRLEASGSYTVFYLENNVKHMVSKSMKEYEAMLDHAVFYRCHNSHVINLKKVNKFIHNMGLFAELTDGSKVEIARKNKDEFLNRLKDINK